MLCISPNTIHRYGEDVRLVPCGKCYNCVMRKVSQWSFRLQQQARNADILDWVTLTYQDEKLIYCDEYETLYKPDLQNFFKLLRIRHVRAGIDTPIKYYACGEYGGRTFRPHYHALIFNSYPGFIDAAWKNGHVHHGTVTPASIGYTLKYMCKPRKLGRNDPRQKEFAVMSNGLGLGYLTDAVRKFHQASCKHLYTVADGKKISLSRYYKEKIFSKDQLDGMKEELQDMAIESDRRYVDKMFKIYKTPQEVQRVLNEMKLQSLERLKTTALKTRV